MCTQRIKLSHVCISLRFALFFCHSYALQIECVCVHSFALAHSLANMCNGNYLQQYLFHLLKLNFFIIIICVVSFEIIVKHMCACFWFAHFVFPFLFCSLSSFRSIFLSLIDLCEHPWTVDNFCFVAGVVCWIADYTIFVEKKKI